MVLEDIRPAHPPLAPSPNIPLDFPQICGSLYLRLLLLFRLLFLKGRRLQLAAFFVFRPLHRGGEKQRKTPGIRKGPGERSIR
jgi:hypothetical protein